ncbi:Putative cytochrome c oxidase assembly factor 2 [Septoria linicola]|uniref:Cytochrome c oxidase assembly factor 2 n=1 Tax=Septoria linicola TaxID=215465 RepID=A0A9Q9ALJ6_9PEZI|nr:putative cytochrome c oxidase assembly factor 2 [Septoria linicola]USW47036.1 Putative cytochrome c oxidase assembly factor 2 [Septoria linicola]
MHYLHPRSRTTGTLFTTTLAVSFAVVAIPHLLPCPVDRRQFADSYETPDGRIMRRRRKQNIADEEVITQEAAEDTEDAKGKRECPLPKPGGLVGQIMGFKNTERPPPTEVIVQTLDKRHLRHPRKESEGTP